MRYQINECLGYWIKRTCRNITNIHDQKLTKLNLTASQVGVLAQLWQTDQLPQKEIQQNLDIRPATLTSLVDTLVVKGYVVRESDQEDARVKRIFLTEEGRALEQSCLAIHKEMEDLLREWFTSEEVSLFLSWMKRMHQNLG